MSSAYETAMMTAYKFSGKRYVGPGCVGVRSDVFQSSSVGSVQTLIHTYDALILFLTPPSHLVFRVPPPVPPSLIHALTRPRFVEVDEVSFKHPVEVGDIIDLQGQVVMTTTPSPSDTATSSLPSAVLSASSCLTHRLPCVMVSVNVIVVRPEVPHTFTSNLFRMVFAFENDDKKDNDAAASTFELPAVVPATSKDVELVSEAWHWAAREGVTVNSV